MNDLVQIGQKIISSIDIAWSPPPLNQVKVNSDRAFKANSGCVGYGGLIRDINGNQLFGHAKSLGFCSAF